MWLDDLIGVFDPVNGVRRKQARLLMSVIDEKRAYDGAKTGRRIDDWITSGASANTEISASGSRLRDRARDLVRNNCYGSKAMEIFVGNAIGTGIIPQARTKSERLNKQIMEAWEIWTSVCDVDGDLDFYGLQALVAGAMFESGECFIRFRDTSFVENSVVPFQIQVLEADFLDTTKTNLHSGTNFINQGIEFDNQNRRVAYWLWPQHPGENALIRTSMQSVRVPAEQIVHVFRKKRPGQIRGVTAYAPSMVRMRDLDGYDDAELWRKKIEACFAAFVVQNSGADGPIVGNVVVKNANGQNGQPAAPQKVEEFRPGMIEYLQPGEDVRFGSPSSDSNYESYERVQLHAIAAGLGITYEQLTGDLSQVNYSSLRAGLLEFRRLIETLRWHVFVPKMCIPVWRCFIDRAYIAGIIPKQDYAVSWTPPKFEMIDPLKDAQADTHMMRNGTLTLKEAIARQGFDPDQQIKEIAETNKQLDELGIKLDCDPRHTAKSGAAQVTDKGAKADETTDKEQLEFDLDDEDESTASDKAGGA
jgi:lambda family phage portal protein